ncbi:MAG: hypothetical protein CMR00_06185 [[Chlorobium] sp. 445]|nr:MAG: hypothetical protein CMR00_06185 [[Chlorobium] sp. 445]
MWVGQAAICSFTCICALVHALQAQTHDSSNINRSLPDSLHVQPHQTLSDANGFSDISFERFLNTYFWRARATYFHTFGDWQLSASENFTSNLAEFLSTASERAVRDENQFQAEAKKRWSQTWGVQVQVSNFLLSDSRSLFRNDAQANALTTGVFYTPWTWLLLETRLGAKAEQQLGQPSSGLTYAVRAELDSLAFGNFLFATNARLSEEFLQPRHNQLLNAQAALRQTYGRTAALFFLGGFERAQRDFFSNVFIANAPEGFTTTVERRTERNLYTVDSLTYQADERLSAAARFELRYRTITRENSQQFLDITRNLYDNEITQQRLSTFLGATYQTASLNLALSFLYQQQAENYRPINALQNLPEAQRLERLRDNALEAASLAFSLGWAIQNADALTLNRFSVQYQMRGFRFDTPSAENNDDRDEVSYFLAVSDSVRVSDFLGLSLTAIGVWSRNVFIFRQQSANSTDNFILRFSPAAVWQVCKGFRNYAEFGVLANYTVYPFETPLQVRSFSFRQFSVVDSAEVFLSKHFFIKFLYDQRIYERGELFWGEFAERPLNSFNDRLVHFELWLQTDVLTTALGVKAFLRQQFGFLNAEKFLQQEVLYIGPTAQVQYRAQNAEFEARGWYQVEQINGAVQRIIPNLILAVQFSW